MLCLIISEEIRCTKLGDDLYVIISQAQLLPIVTSFLLTPHYMCQASQEQTHLTPTISWSPLYLNDLATLFRAHTKDEDVSQAGGSRVHVLTHCTADTSSEYSTSLLWSFKHHPPSILAIFRMPHTYFKSNSFKLEAISVPSVFFPGKLAEKGVDMPSGES